jgi:hypothetical protein
LSNDTPALKTESSNTSISVIQRRKKLNGSKSVEAFNMIPTGGEKSQTIASLKNISKIMMFQANLFYRGNKSSD